MLRFLNCEIIFFICFYKLILLVLLGNFLNFPILPFAFFFEKFIISIILILMVLLAVAFFTLVERKVMGFMQRRRGPNVVGFYGVLQPLADGVKLLLKETILPSRANDILFYFSPIFTFFLSLVS